MAQNSLFIKAAFFVVLVTVLASTTHAVCGYPHMVFTTPFNLTSPGYPIAYQNNQSCGWTLHTSSLYKVVKVVVIDSQLQSDPTCQHDYVEAYDGSNENYPLLKKWCGSETPTLQSSGRYMRIKFKTDATHTYRGFRLIYFQKSVYIPCGGNLTANSTESVLISPNFPYNYDYEVSCVWTIKTTETNIMITAFDTQLHSSEGCYADYVQVNDGPSNSSRLMGKYCGRQNPTYYSTGRYVTITFDSIYKKDFKLRYIGGSFSPCGNTDLLASTTNTRYLSSPNYPKDYPSGLICEWRIDSGGNNFDLYIKFLAYDIQKSVGCAKDYVTMFDGYDDNAWLLGTRCGFSSFPTTQSSGRYIFIRFRTDGAISAPGFRIAYLAKDNGKSNSGADTPIGAIVGAVVGAVVFIAIIIVIVIVIVKTKSPTTVTAAHFRKDREGGNVSTVEHRSTTKPVHPNSSPSA